MFKRLVVLLLFVQISFGQTKEGLELCILYKNSFSAFTTEKEANEALDKILNVIGASKNFTLIPCDDINNALAVTFKGDRFILFDGKFMRDITQLTNSWANMFILAHEVGHHINGHTRDFLLATVLDDQSLEDRRKEELEADEFAAFVVSKLGASFAQIEETIKLIASNKNDLYSTHPSYDKRIAAVKRGFDKAYSDSSSSGSDSYSTNGYSTEITKKGEMIPRYENPRRGIYRAGGITEDGKLRLSGHLPYSSAFGSWQTLKSYDLENYINPYSKHGTKKIITDPFEIQSQENLRPVKYVEAKTKGKALSPYGSKNVELKVEIKTWKNNYIFNRGLKTKYENFYIPHKEFKIILTGWADSPKELLFAPFDTPTYATFNYIIDGEFSGQFVTLVGWYEVKYDRETFEELAEPIMVPAELEFNYKVDKLNSTVSKFLQKKNYEFVERLKAGKKLYLRFGNLFYWNGYNGQEGDYDTSQISYDYSIPRYTYEFDLTGSSKAISF